MNIHPVADTAAITGAAEVVEETTVVEEVMVAAAITIVVAVVEETAGTAAVVAEETTATLKSVIDIFITRKPGDLSPGFLFAATNHTNFSDKYISVIKRDSRKKLRILNSFNLADFIFVSISVIRGQLLSSFIYF